MSLYMARNKGFYGEDVACMLLKTYGFTIIERNFNTKFGEIDIIAHKKGIIHFVEVKTTYGEYNPAENFHKTKLRRFVKTVKIYCFINKIKESDIQIDLALVNLRDRRFNLIQNANLYFH
jgi:putative endonuclease